MFSRHLKSSDRNRHTNDNMKNRHTNDNMNVEAEVGTWGLAQPVGFRGVGMYWDIFPRDSGYDFIPKTKGISQVGKHCGKSHRSLKTNEARVAKN